MYTTFLYDGTFNGLISAVYDAFYSRLPAGEVRIIEDSPKDDFPAAGFPINGFQAAGSPINGFPTVGSPKNRSPANNPPKYAPTLFDREITVETSEEKVKKVLSALIKKTSYETYHNIYLIYLSYYPDKGNLIYKYVKLCFDMGQNVFIHISHPDIFEVKRICGRVSRETHKLLGFVRFRQISGGIYFSRITPENNQLELIAPHFSERMYGDNWMIYDAGRGFLCIHKAKEIFGRDNDDLKNDFYITDDIPEDILNDDMDSLNTNEESKYSELWKSFFETVGIAERFNPRCQRNLMPKRYWGNMVEMKDKL